jgi:hypothetical protein
MDASLENKSKYLALAFTICFHALLFLLFIYIVFITPIPAFEIKEVPTIDIDLGTEGLGNATAGGSGNHDNDIATSMDASSQPTVSTDAPNVITDPTETDVSVKSNPKNNKDTPVETPTVQEQKESAELLNALAILKKKAKHKGNGEGGGNTGGSGTGTNTGVGPGNDNGHGNDTPGTDGSGDYKLTGRIVTKRPDPMTDNKEEGKVIVEIIVDETGKVIKATPGLPGSNTTSSNLYAKARQAALSVKFNASSKGIKEQRGTFTFVFTLE